MSHKPRVEAFARQLDAETTTSVRSASAQKTASRVATLSDTYADPDLARAEAARIKDYVLDHLKALLLQFEAAAIAQGAAVHWCADAKEAREVILKICQDAAPGGGVVAKAKSMATEEIHLNGHLEAHGYSPIETDLGEFVVQIDHDTPSHIVTPIIHKNRKQIAKSFEREHLGPYSEVPEVLAMQARSHLREKFRTAKVGISGVNFAVAETGRLVLVENEGNNRLSTTAPDTHIAVMGIEKLVPTEGDLALFLRLLAGSATGQRITSYVHFISGPRRQGDADGPSQVHIILLDNGRSKVLNGPYREILRCIRCGACLNVCPVYRQASGHAYGHVYSGPLGAVLAPALEGIEKLGELSKASSLCGACEEVCPVKIPIPKMLLQLRDEAVRAGAVKETIPWNAFAFGATKPSGWRTGLKFLPMAKFAPTAATEGWTEFREMPAKGGRDFRGWWKSR